MSKATLLTRYVTLAEKKARVEVEMLEARIALFEAHGYVYCAPEDPRRVAMDQETRDRWLLYKIGAGYHSPLSLAWLVEKGHFTEQQIAEARKTHAADIERLGRSRLQRPMVLVPDLGWYGASEAWRHLLRTIPRRSSRKRPRVHLVDQESSS